MSRSAVQIRVGAFFLYFYCIYDDENDVSLILVVIVILGPLSSLASGRAAWAGRVAQPSTLE
jgi:hypothetical protein